VTCIKMCLVKLKAAFGKCVIVFERSHC